nr:MAG TPA: hypothetical protein [Caudoviricetes sp.]
MQIKRNVQRLVERRRLQAYGSRNGRTIHRLRSS